MELRSKARQRTSLSPSSFKWLCWEIAPRRSSRLEDKRTPIRLIRVHLRAPKRLLFDFFLCNFISPLDFILPRLYHLCLISKWPLNLLENVCGLSAYAFASLRGDLALIKSSSTFQPTFRAARIDTQWKAVRRRATVKTLRRVERIVLISIPWSPVLWTPRFNFSFSHLARVRVRAIKCLEILFRTFFWDSTASRNFKLKRTVNCEDSLMLCGVR